MLFLINIISLPKILTMKNALPAFSTGLFLELSIDSKSIENLLMHPFKQAICEQKLGYYFAELLYNRKKNPEDIFLFNFDSENNKLYFAFVPNNFTTEYYTSFSEILKLFCYYKDSTTDYAVFASTLPAVYDAMKLDKKKCEMMHANSNSVDLATKWVEKYWSLANKKVFPSAENAMKIEGYFDKNFQEYYINFLDFMSDN